MKGRQQPQHREQMVKGQRAGHTRGEGLGKVESRPGRKQNGGRVEGRPDQGNRTGTGHGAANLREQTELGGRGQAKV